MTQPRTKRRWIFVGLSLSLSLIGCLTLLELGVRLFSTQGSSLLVKDGIVGQRYLKSYRGKRFIPESSRTVELQFNREGYRGPDRPVEKGPVKRAAVLGDSFVAAIAVDERDTMVAQLERLLEATNARAQWEVFNFGVSGNSTGQSLLTWRRFACKYRPDLVLLCFYNGNDLAENSSSLSTANRPYFCVDESGCLVQEPFSQARASSSRWLSQHSQLYVWQKHKMRVLRNHFRKTAKVLPAGFQIMNTKPAPAVETAWRTTEELLATLNREVEQTGATFVLVSIPCHEQLSEDRWRQLCETVGPEESVHFDRDHPESRLSEICQRQGINMLPLVDVFREQIDKGPLHFRSEGHWNERGNLLAAEGLCDFLAVRCTALFETGATRTR